MQNYKYFFNFRKYFFYYFVNISKMLKLQNKKNLENPFFNLIIEQIINKTD